MTIISRIWTGGSPAAWLPRIMKVWDGSVWQERPHYWNGSAWIPMFAEFGLDTTITAVVQEVYHSGWSPHITVEGFDAGPDPWEYAGTFGSIAQNTYQDGGNNTRTVGSCYHHIATGILTMVLETIGVPNTDATFISMKIGGTTYTRASSFYSVSVDGGSQWLWNGLFSVVFLGPNPHNFELIT